MICIYSYIHVQKADQCTPACADNGNEVKIAVDNKSTVKETPPAVRQRRVMATGTQSWSVSITFSIASDSRVMFINSSRALSLSKAFPGSEIVFKKIR